MQHDQCAYHEGIRQELKCRFACPSITVIVDSKPDNYFAETLEEKAETFEPKPRRQAKPQLEEELSMRKQ